MEEMNRGPGYYVADYEKETHELQESFTQSVTAVTANLLPWLIRPLIRLRNWITEGYPTVQCGSPKIDEEDGIESKKQSGLTSSGKRRATPETIGRVASWFATLALSLCWLSIISSRPLLQSQGPHSLWLAIVAMFTFTVFVCAVHIMKLVGARLTRMQIIMLLISAVAAFFLPSFPRHPFGFVMSA